MKQTKMIFTVKSIDNKWKYDLEVNHLAISNYVS